MPRSTFSSALLAPVPVFVRRPGKLRAAGPRGAERDKKIFNRGTPSNDFLAELLLFGKRIKTEAPEVYAPNKVAVDIFTVLKPYLATPIGKDPSGTQLYQWDSLLHRLAALLEAERVHAGMESSWDWNEGVDITNHASMTHIEGQETGVFQVSFDSTYLGQGAMKPFAKAHGIDTPERFIRAMKRDHQLALEYYARLARVSIRWAGPLLRHGNDSIYPWLNRKAVAEFIALLS